MNAVNRLVAQKKYSEALDLLEAEIPVAQIKAKVGKDSEDLFNMLAQRSLVFFKLRKYNASKIDANELIRLDPQNTRGYLYKAKVYTENGHYKLAIQALRACLKALPKHSDQRDSIKELITSISARSLYKFADPVQKLPYEILLMIFTSLVKRPSTAVQMSLVSKTWYKHFSGEPRYWSRLRFSRPVSAHTVMRACDLSAGQPLSLDIYCNLASSTSFLRNLARIGHLTTLCLNTGQFAIREMRQIKLKLPRLHYLKAPSDAVNLDLAWILESFWNLKRLCLIELPAKDKTVVDDLKLNSPLQALEIVGNSRSRLSRLLLASVLNQCALSVLSLDQIECPIEVVTAVLQQRSLRSYSYSANPSMSSVLQCAIESPLQSLVLKYVKLEPAIKDLPDSIKYLDVQNCDFQELSVPGLIRRLRCSSTVETIVLSANRVVVQNEPAEYDRLPMLQTLEFTSMPILINGRFIEWVEQTMPNLKHVNLNESPIEGRFITRLLQHGVTNISCRGAFEIGSSLMQQIQSMPGVKVAFK